MLDNLISILIQLVVLYWGNQLLLILSTIGLLNGWNVKHPIIIFSIQTNTDKRKKETDFGRILSFIQRVHQSLTVPDKTHDAFNSPRSEKASLNEDR